MILRSLSHWGMVALPDCEWMGNLFIDSDGVICRLEYDEPTYMKQPYPIRRPAMIDAALAEENPDGA